METGMNIGKLVVDEDTEDSKKIDDDYVTTSMGAFGIWQLLVCSIAAATRLIVMSNMLMMFFLSPSTEFICVNFNENVTRTTENSTCYEDCTKYAYYDGIFDSNIISEFELVCNRAWLTSFVQSVLMFGLLLGVALFGWISDRFGRKKALTLALLTDTLFMFIVPYSTNYWIFTSLRFFIGLATGGIIATTTVFVLEIVGPQHREAAASAALSPDILSQLLLPLYAYFTSSWNEFLLVNAAVALIISLPLFLLPETPRWLIANGKVNEAIEVMTKAAKFNKRSTIGITENVIRTVEEIQTRRKKNYKVTYLDLFRERRLAIVTTGLSIASFVSGASFFGISQYSTFLGMNLYVVVAIMAIVEVPGFLIVVPITKLYGRNIPATCTFILISITMVIIIFIPEKCWYSTLFGMVGVALGNVNFIIMYFYASELYPTQIRNMGFGCSVSASKFGAIVAPFIANIKPDWVALLVFAVLSFIAAVLCLVLPETKGKVLKDMLKE